MTNARWTHLLAIVPLVLAVIAIGAALEIGSNLFDHYARYGLGHALVDAGMSFLAAACAIGCITAAGFLAMKGLDL